MCGGRILNQEVFQNTGVKYCLTSLPYCIFPAEFQPTVQSIDTWFISRKIGMLFEAKVLNGKLMMTSMDITSQPEKRIVARQMHKAILNYMNSDAFRPADKIAPELIQALFTKVAGDVKSYTKDSPDELKPKIN